MKEFSCLGVIVVVVGKDRLCAKLYWDRATVLYFKDYTFQGDFKDTVSLRQRRATEPKKVCGG